MSVLTESRAAQVVHAACTVSEADMSELVAKLRSRKLPNDVESEALDTALVCLADGIAADVNEAVNYGVLNGWRRHVRALSKFGNSLEYVLENDPMEVSIRHVQFGSPDSVATWTIDDALDESMQRLALESPEHFAIVCALADRAGAWKANGTINLVALQTSLGGVKRRNGFADKVYSALGALREQVVYTLARYAHEAGKARFAWSETDIALARELIESMAAVGGGKAGKGHLLPSNQTYASRVATRRVEDIRSAKQEDRFARVGAFWETLEGKSLKA